MHFNFAGYWCAYISAAHRLCARTPSRVVYVAAEHPHFVCTAPFTSRRASEDIHVEISETTPKSPGLSIDCHTSMGGGNITSWNHAGTASSSNHPLVARGPLFVLIAAFQYNVLLRAERLTAAAAHRVYCFVESSHWMVFTGRRTE